jgi:hypothetical protein
MPAQQSSENKLIPLLKIFKILEINFSSDQGSDNVHDKIIFIHMIILILEIGILTI